MADTPTQTQQPRRHFYVVFDIGDDEADGGSKLGQPPASKASIEAMPRIKVKESGGDCSICLEEFEVGEEAREMPCKHVFHSGCIEKWLQIHGSCPVCRFLMPVETVEARDGDDGRGSLEGGEINALEFFQSVLALASLASMMGVLSSGRAFNLPVLGHDSHQPSDTSSSQNTD
ncbi:hypothetical protein HRI_004082600 [Hibiscus trionum]|uniref:RING-type E3 ubiquitin transferase n=1 Tax=Hibiscus trionum TaxID=183268 RepID=A0A9W7MJD3_HIBTR|nr:hypothetical protein HRI_004082600 [Hibiscus trionum]